jgi:hypothetical protein
MRAALNQLIRSLTMYSISLICAIQSTCVILVRVPSSTTAILGFRVGGGIVHWRIGVWRVRWVCVLIHYIFTLVYKWEEAGVGRRGRGEGWDIL